MIKSFTNGGIVTEEATSFLKKTPSRTGLKSHAVTEVRRETKIIQVTAIHNLNQ
jgi:hypothetical protein